ncbi:outer membrane beta-barrel protein [Desulforhopalus sp. 52FAK]
MNVEKSIKMGIVLGISGLTLGFASNCLAGEAETRQNYMQLKLGALFPTSDLDDGGFDDTGFSGTFAYGRYLSDHLILEGSIDLSGQGNDDEASSNGVAGSYSKDSSLATQAILLTLKGEYPLGPVDLFGGGGVGLYGTYICADIESDALGDFDVDDNDSVFGVHVVAGANYNINDRFFLGLEAMYRWTEDIDISATTASIPFEYNGDLSAVIVTFNAGFRF